MEVKAQRVMIAAKTIKGLRLLLNRQTQSVVINFDTKHMAV